MIIRIPREIYEQFVEKRLDIEVSLEWVLGYVQQDFTKLLHPSLLSFSEENMVDVDIPKDTYEQIRLHINPQMDMNKAVAFFCLVAFSLGGGR